MSRYGPMCDVDETEPAHIRELRRYVEEFDILMEDCWDVKLTSEENRELNEMYGALSLMEQSYWDGVSEQTFALLQSRLDEEFPMIRYMLGMISPTPPE